MLAGNQVVTVPVGFGAVNLEHQKTFLLPNHEDPAGEFQALMTAPRGREGYLGAGTAGSSPSSQPIRSLTLCLSCQGHSGISTDMGTAEEKAVKQSWPHMPRDRQDGRSASPWL